MNKILVRNGITFIADQHVSDLHNVKRTMLERLFTWPWNPWVSTKVVERARAYRVMDDKTVLISFKTMAHLESLQK